MHIFGQTFSDIIVDPKPQIDADRDIVFRNQILFILLLRKRTCLYFRAVEQETHGAHTGGKEEQRCVRLNTF